MSLLIVGTVAFDTIETPFGKAEKVIGGAGTYASWAASYLKDNIRLVSIIGEDWPKNELQKMNLRGINTDGIHVVPNGKSFFWIGKYADNMIERETLATELNVLADFDPKLPPFYKDSEYVLLGNLTPAVQMSVVEQMSKRPKLIVLDTMNFWIDSERDSLMEVIKKIDILSINDEEARMLSNEYNLVKAADRILQYGPKYVIIKKGEHGALLFSKEQMFFAPAMPLSKISDPTGAGDSFAGGLMGYISSQGKTDFETVKQGLVYGAAMGSFCVEDFSLDKLQNISTQDIAKRVADLKTLSQV
ncbi:PfkB family carbohydrate kinase [Membranihabitans maritimus]|uniref:PfkB family carbohydrate kinase n=1 Tax=Membranihabitans maritimus TaxID=2904244 RepID=UPI001F47EED0|nr:PfkB family carbohydrate kinase [Membranihabitans maritimus]